MEMAEATRLVALLCAAYRVNDPATATVYIEMLKDLDEDVTRVAIESLIKDESDWMPSVHAIRERAMMVRRDWVAQNSRAALPPPRVLTEDDKARIKEILGQYWGKYPGRQKHALASATRDGDVEAKVEAGRLRVREQMQEPDGGPTPITVSGRIRVCTGAGKQTVIRQGKFYCPDCGTEVV